MYKKIKLEQIVAIASICFCVFAIYKGVNHIRWKEANCEKVYYSRIDRVCVKTKLVPISTGKATVIIKKCIQYKDTVVNPWRYKCPTKTK